LDENSIPIACRIYTLLDGRVISRYVDDL
jgi:hypothetical protein